MELQQSFRTQFLQIKSMHIKKYRKNIWYDTYEFIYFISFNVSYVNDFLGVWCCLLSRVIIEKWLINDKGISMVDYHNMI